MLFEESPRFSAAWLARTATTEILNRFLEMVIRQTGSSLVILWHFDAGTDSLHPAILARPRHEPALPEAPSVEAAWQAHVAQKSLAREGAGVWIPLRNAQGRPLGVLELKLVASQAPAAAQAMLSRNLIDRLQAVMEENILRSLDP